MDKAKARYAGLSPESRAMISGFAAGYNTYVADTPAGDLPGKCANQPWVTAITPQALYAYYELISLYASGDQFTTGVTFSAAPPGVNPSPTPVNSTVYELRLAAGDNMSYMKDGQAKPITSKTFTIKVANGSPTPTVLQKTFYYSEYGPMVAANLVNSAAPAWGDSLGGKPVAFSYRDANADTASQVVDQWLGMGRAHNLAQFKQPFQACGSVLWVHTMYADKSGQAFYIDGTSVPNLSAKALAAYQQLVESNPMVAGLAKAGITLLDGSTSRDDWVQGKCGGRTGYAAMPKLERRDFVQNSNDSYWATNPADFLTGYSPLYGPTKSILSPRTRMSLKMLEHPTDAGLSGVKPAGDDGKFTGQKIINALYSNRAYYAELLLPDLLQRCQKAGNTTIPTTSGNSRSVAAGCSALAGWDGVYNTDSTGAQVFRVFVANYAPSYPDQFTVAFDKSDPANTPSTPKPARRIPPTIPCCKHWRSRSTSLTRAVLLTTRRWAKCSTSSNQPACRRGQALLRAAP